MRVWRGLFMSVLCVAGVAMCFWAGRLFLRQVGRDVPITPQCSTRAGTFFAGNERDRAGYDACLEERAKRFFDRDYSETRDISKAFLTLLTAVFVASITFSEKIVNVSTSGWWPRALMIC